MTPVRENIFLNRSMTVKEEHDHDQVLFEGAIRVSWEEGGTRFWRRLKAVSLYEQGYSTEEICNILDVSRCSVFYWVNRYRKLGIRGLIEEYHPGRPRRLAEEELERLGEILDSGPVAYGFSSGIWTCARVGHVIQAEFGVRYHEDHVRKILH